VVADRKGQLVADDLLTASPAGRVSAGQTASNTFAVATGECMCNAIIPDSVQQVWSFSKSGRLLLSEGVQAHKKEGPKFIQRLVAKQKAKGKDS
jgi:hypothetical protein